MAEAFNSIFKAEFVRNRGPWKKIDDLQVAVAEYIDWYNHRRLHRQIGLVPPVEYENLYYQQNPSDYRRGVRTEPPLPGTGQVDRRCRLLLG